MIFTGPTTTPYSLVHPRFAPGAAIFGVAFAASHMTSHANVDLRCIADSQDHVVVSHKFEHCSE
jgi:hypothetical protein